MTKPRPAIAVLLHERRFTRFLVLTRDVPWVPGRCAWCGGDKPRGLKYCGAECEEEAGIRACGVVVEIAVMRRDRGVCAVCGMDCVWLEQQRKSMWYARKTWPYGSPVLPGSWGPWRSSGRLWEADHILPVCEGGGVCGLDNYRTLCLRCHKLDTAALAGRMAARKQKQGRLAI